MKMWLSHYKWLEKNFKKFCENSGYKYYYGAISAHGDKLESFRSMCEEEGIPFYKASAIGLILFMDHHGIEDYFEHMRFGIKLYKEHPEWYNGCGGEEDAFDCWY